MQGEDVADHGAEDEDYARGVELEHFLAEGRFGGLDVGGELEEEEEDCGGYAADGEVTGWG